MLAFDNGRSSGPGAAGAHDIAGARSTVSIVCSPRPRVGKTLAARLLVEFFLVDDRPVLAFDANPNDPVLSDYLPHHSELATVADTRGQMALFDRLIVNDGIPKVIDLATDQFAPFFEVMRETDFADAAKRRSIDTVVLFVAENHPRSAEAYRRILDSFREATVVPVHNEVVENYGAPSAAHPSSGPMPVNIPHLPPYLHGVVRRPGFSISDFLRRPAQFPTLLHKWISHPFIGFRDLELRLSLADFAPLFRIYA